MTNGHHGNVGNITSDFTAARIGDLLSSASDITLSLTPAGIIQAVFVNRDARSLGDLAHWRGRPITDFLNVESREKFRRRMEELAQGRTDALRPIELNHVDRATWEFPIRYGLWRDGPDGPLIMLGHDLRPMAEIQQQLVAAQVALEKDDEYHRQIETRYRVMLESRDVPVLFADAGTGRIIDLNQATVLLLNADRASITGRKLDQVFNTPGRASLHDQLGSADSGSGPIEVLSADGTRRLDLSARPFRAAGVATLMIEVTEQARGEPAPRPLDAGLARLYAMSTDGIAILDTSGNLTASNEAFLSQCDVARLSEIEGRPLSDFLARGSVDQRVLLEQCRRKGAIRLYATRLQRAFGNELSVELSAVSLGEDAGFGLIVRDISRRDPGRETDLSAAQPGVNNVMELVGGTPLKEIVSATTDVIERICIETALDLTNNNRVAAAEMLGLSRQSLYVKLRKFDLLSRDG